MEYDYIIIRSGFGGLVSALRLSKGIYCFSDWKEKWFNAKDFLKPIEFKKMTLVSKSTFL
jgi:cholesterol oxidase